MSKKTVRITSDITVTHARVFKLICDCGWYDKFYENEHLKKARAHLLGKHNGGLILKNGQTEEVLPDNVVRIDSRRTA